MLEAGISSVTEVAYIGLQGNVSTRIHCTLLDCGGLKTALQGGNFEGPTLKLFMLPMLPSSSTVLLASSKFA